TAPGSRHIVAAPVGGGDDPATIGKPQRDGGADPPLATRPGHQRDLLACPSVVHTRLLVFAHSSPISLRSIRPTRAKLLRRLTGGLWMALVHSNSARGRDYSPGNAAPTLLPPDRTRRGVGLRARRPRLPPHSPAGRPFST